MSTNPNVDSQIALECLKNRRSEHELWEGASLSARKSNNPAGLCERSRSEGSAAKSDARPVSSNLPITVKEAARFLGVSPQTVYLWVERKQIPHFRVMGRNIRS